jgi:hypothetical protein
MGAPIRNLLLGKSRVIFWVLLGILFILNLLYKWSLVNTFAPDLGGFERNVILGIQQILLGKGLYSNPETVPFFIIQYMPLYYHLVAGLATVFQIDPTDAHSLYQLARGTNLILILGSCFLLFQTASQHFKVPKSIAIPTALLAFFWMEKFTLSGRPDTLKAFLFQGLVYILLSFPEKRKRWIFPMACLIGSMAFATKQDGLVFLGILPLALLFGGNWKETFVWGLISALGIGLVVGFSQTILSTDFLANVAGGLQNGISISWFVGAFGNYFGLMALLFGLGLVLSLEFAFEENHKLRVVAASFFCSFFPALLFSLKYGSGPNYFLECTLISLLILSVWLKTEPFKGRFIHPQTTNLLATLVVGMLFLVPAIHWTTAVFLNQENQLKQSYESARKLAVSLRSRTVEGGKKPLVLVDNARQWEDNLSTLIPDLLVAGQRDVIVQIADARGKTDYSGLRQILESGQVDFIVTEAGKKPGFLGFDYSKYQSKTEFEGFWVWRK